MAEFRNPIYKFKFADPILFRRVYDFKTYSPSANEYWFPIDSDKKEVAIYQTKNTLVYDMTLKESMLNSYYYVTIRGANTCDAFKVLAKNISCLLKMFDIVQ